MPKKKNPVKYMVLNDAVVAGDVAHAEKLIAAGADLEAKDTRTSNGQNWGYRFATQRSLVKHMVGKPEDNMVRGFSEERPTVTKGDTPLRSAVRYGNLVMVQLLVTHGAKKDAADADGDTPLMMAAVNGYVDVAEYLLEQGCDVNKTNEDGFTALHCAAISCQVKVAKLLMRWGADLNARDKEGQQPLDRANNDRNWKYYVDNDGDDDDDEGKSTDNPVAVAIRAEIELRGSNPAGFKRDRSTIEGTEEHEAAKRPRVEEEEVPDESDDDDDDDDDDEEGA
jgi:hypothetical protein